MRSQTELYLPSIVDVSRETWERLEVFFSWHEKCRSYSSFTKYRDEEDFWKRHVGNSLQLVPYIQSQDVILDVGTGGGFPGVVLAALGFEVILSDLDRKKRFFLKEALRQMNLDCPVIADSKAYEGFFSVVTARAVTSLKDLFTLVPRVSRETKGLFLKGGRLAEEIDEAKKVADFSYKVHHYGEGSVLEVLWTTSS